MGHGVHINVKEMEAVWLSIQAFAPKLYGHHVLVMTDSMTAKAYINRQGGMKSESCRVWAREIWLWVASMQSPSALYMFKGNRMSQQISYRGGVRMQTIGVSIRAFWAGFGTNSGKLVWTFSRRRRMRSVHCGSA